MVDRIRSLLAGLGCPQREGDIPFFGQGVGVISVRPAFDAGSRLRLIDNGYHGRRRSVKIFRDHQPPFGLLQRGPVELYPMLHEVIPLLAGEDLWLLIGDQIRPLTHHLHPAIPDLLPPLFPLISGCDLSAVVEPKWRAVVAKISFKLIRGAAKASNTLA